jgi:hypothetical protein
MEEQDGNAVGIERFGDIDAVVVRARPHIQDGANAKHQVVDASNDIASD